MRINSNLTHSCRTNFWSEQMIAGLGTILRSDEYDNEVFICFGGRMVSRETVVAALKNCYDPEIPVNIVDLGLVYEVRIDGSLVEVDMTLTAPGCPMSVHISEDVRTKLLAVEGIEMARVNMVWEPMWTPERMSEEAKKALGFG